jgi:hypothetical protein
LSTKSPQPSEPSTICLSLKRGRSLGAAICFIPCQRFANPNLDPRPSIWHPDLWEYKTVLPFVQVSVFPEFSQFNVTSLEVRRVQSRCRYDLIQLSSRVFIYYNDTTFRQHCQSCTYWCTYAHQQFWSSIWPAVVSHSCPSVVLHTNSFARA